MEKKRKKRIVRNWYTSEKFFYSEGPGWHYESLEDRCLYSEGKYKTKIKEDDLPEWFIPVRMYKMHGFLSAKGVKDLKLDPNWIFNHYHKYDWLHISYDKDIVIEEKPSGFGNFTYKDYQNYDYALDSSGIVSFVKAVKKYSPDVNVDEVVSQIYEKSRWMLRAHPNDVEHSRLKLLDEWFGGDPLLKNNWLYSVTELDTMLSAQETDEEYIKSVERVYNYKIKDETLRKILSFADSKDEKYFAECFAILSRDKISNTETLYNSKADLSVDIIPVINTLNHYMIGYNLKKKHWCICKPRHYGTNTECEKFKSVYEAINNKNNT